MVVCEKCGLVIGHAQSASFIISHRGECATNVTPPGRVADQVAAAVVVVEWAGKGTTCALVIGSAIIANSTTLPHETSVSNAPALNDVHCSPSTREHQGPRQREGGCATRNIYIEDEIFLFNLT